MKMDVEEFCVSEALKLTLFRLEGSCLLLKILGKDLYNLVRNCFPKMYRTERWVGTCLRYVSLEE